MVKKLFSLIVKWEIGILIKTNKLGNYLINKLK